MNERPDRSSVHSSPVEPAGDPRCSQLGPPVRTVRPQVNDQPVRRVVAGHGSAREDDSRSDRTLGAAVVRPGAERSTGKSDSSAPTCQVVDNYATQITSDSGLDLHVTPRCPAVQAPEAPRSAAVAAAGGRPMQSRCHTCGPVELAPGSSRSRVVRDGGVAAGFDQCFDRRIAVPKAAPRV